MTENTQNTWVALFVLHKYVRIKRRAICTNYYFMKSLLFDKWSFHLFLSWFQIFRNMKPWGWVVVGKAVKKFLVLCFCFQRVQLFQDSASWLHCWRPLKVGTSCFLVPRWWPPGSQHDPEPELCDEVVLWYIVHLTEDDFVLGCIVWPQTLCPWG